jgi:hypothetical protein
VQAWHHYRCLVVEAQPFLDAAESGALGEIAEQHEVERERSGENAVAGIDYSNASRLS